ncbi:MAG: aspartyl protease family protein [Flavobacteriales bacterium]|nr:aspartyl protease family protein [Flavobacteriales bacterium]
MKKKQQIKLQIAAMGDEGCHIFCKAKINGMYARVLIDTGASKTVMSKEFADGLTNLKHIEIDENKTAGVGAEPVQADFAKIKKLKLKKWTIKKLIVGIMDLSHVKPLYESVGVEPFDAILGGDVLQMSNAKIDYKKQQLTLH